MKILKAGKTLNESQTMYFICYKCGCEYSCETTEPICKKFTDKDPYTHYGTFYECNCPNCNNSNIGMNYPEYLKIKNG